MTSLALDTLEDATIIERQIVSMTASEWEQGSVASAEKAGENHSLSGVADRVGLIDGRPRGQVKSINSALLKVASAYGSAPGVGRESELFDALQPGMAFVVELLYRGPIVCWW